MDINDKINKVREKYKELQSKKPKSEVAIVLTEYLDCWRKKYDCSEPPRYFTKKERELVRQLIKKYGVERVVNLIKYVFEHWEFLAERWRLLGAPTVEILATWCQSLIVEADKWSLKS